jgi:hypothetical protein
MEPRISSAHNYDYTQFTSPPASWMNGVGNGYPVCDRQGTLGRNQVYGPSLCTLDASLFKNFPTTPMPVGENSC